MTVGELMKELEHHDPDEEVMFSYNYGDYWRSQVAEEVTEMDLYYVRWSSYHNMYKIVPEDDDINDDKDKNVLILGNW